MSREPSNTIKQNGILHLVGVHATQYYLRITESKIIPVSYSHAVAAFIATFYLIVKKCVPSSLRKAYKLNYSVHAVVNLVKSNVCSARRDFAPIASIVCVSIRPCHCLADSFLCRAYFPLQQSILMTKQDTGLLAIVCRANFLSAGGAGEVAADGMTNGEAKINSFKLHRI